MPQFELLLRDEFSAAHQLRLLDGRLEPLHGHNWEVEVFIQGDGLDQMEVLADFTVLQPQLREITAGLHDTFLNQVPGFAGVNPSTERVAQYIHDALRPKLPGNIRITKVRVWETRTCAAAYIP